jgi:hypothetical protein
MKLLLTLILVGSLGFSAELLGQDLSAGRVAIIGFTGGINEEVLNGLDPRRTDDVPYTSEEKELQGRVGKRLEKLFLDGAYKLLQKQLEERGIQLEPLTISEKVATLNESGYPNPLVPKSNIKKKNDDYADYFLNINIVCSKPILGGLSGFRPVARMRIVLFDGSGNKIKTINEEVKGPNSVRSTDFDEEWTRPVERFNRMDWYSVSLLEERLRPIVNAVVTQSVDQL